MKKLLSIIIVIALAAPFFTACKKGENDPGISLKSRTARLVGEWEVLTYDQKDTDNDGDTETISVDGSSFMMTSVWSGTTYTSTGTASISMTIEKDGTFESVENYTITGDGYTITDNTTLKGVWYWADGNKELETKGKEMFIMQTTDRTYFNGNDTYVYSYEGVQCPVSYVQIDMLKSKELGIKMEGQYTSSNGVSTTTVEGTYEKK